MCIQPGSKLKHPLISTADGNYLKMVRPQKNEKTCYNSGGFLWFFSVLDPKNLAQHHQNASKAPANAAKMPPNTKKTPPDTQTRQIEKHKTCVFLRGL